MSCVVCGSNAVEINEDDNLCLECFNDDKVGYDSETEGYADTIVLCMACGSAEDLVNDMYCDDCNKRQRFLDIFQESRCYDLGAYFGKHLLEKYLGYYVSETTFIAFMLVRGYKFNETKRTFRVKVNKKKALEILGIRV